MIEELKEYNTSQYFNQMFNSIQFHSIQFRSICICADLNTDELTVGSINWITIILSTIIMKETLVNLLWNSFKFNPNTHRLAKTSCHRFLVCFADKRMHRLKLHFPLLVYSHHPAAPCSELHFIHKSHQQAEENLFLFAMTFLQFAVFMRRRSRRISSSWHFNANETLSLTTEGLRCVHVSSQTAWV